MLTPLLTPLMHVAPGDIVYVELPDVGAEFEKAETFGSVEVGVCVGGVGWVCTHTRAHCARTSRGDFAQE